MPAEATAHADVELDARRELPGHADAAHAAVPRAGEMLHGELHEHAHRRTERPGRVDGEQPAVRLAVDRLEIETRGAVRPVVPFEGGAQRVLALGIAKIVLAVGQLDAREDAPGGLARGRPR